MRIKTLILTLGALSALSLPAAHAARGHKPKLTSVLREIIPVATPKDQETCFSPDMPCDLKLIEFVKSAQSSLDIAIYDINIDQLVHQILVQSKKMPVRIVVDRKQAKGSHSLVSTLVKGGADVRFGTQRGIMHDKFTIVDGKTIETGSFNYTNHASTSNQENQLYLANPSVVAAYKQRFEKIWSTAKKVELAD